MSLVAHDYRAAEELALAELLQGGLFVDGDWIESKDQDPNGQVRLIQLADIGDGVFRDRSSRFLTLDKAKELRCTFLEPGDILVARMPEPLGRACIFPGVGQPAVTAVDVCIVRPERNRARPEWLVKAINSPLFRNSMQQFVRGTTRQRISRTNLGSLRLVVPEIDLQAEIAALGDEIESRRGAAVSHVIAGRRAIERFRQAVLSAACSGRLTEDWREKESDAGVNSLHEIAMEERKSSYGRRYADPPIVNSDELPVLPDGWQWTSLASLIVSGPQNGLYLPQSQYGDGSPILRIEDYQLEWSRSSDELKRVAASPDDRERYSLSVGDIIVNRVNSPSHLGKTLLVQERNLPALFESNMMRFSLISSVAPNYVAIFLQSMYGRQMLTKNAKWAVNQASINQRDVSATPIAIPALDEQVEIVRRVDRLLEVASSLSQRVTIAKARVDRSSQAVLARAFRGELYIKRNDRTAPMPPRSPDKDAT